MSRIVFGLVFIVGGLSGKMALRGTDSGGALAVFGVVLLGMGIYSLVQSKGQ